MLRGIDVLLHVKAETGRDWTNAPIYSDSTVTVSNVIVSPSTPEEIIQGEQLYGKRAVFTLGIPKGDEHTWEDTVVEFFDHKFETFGFVEEGIEELVPGPWHAKVRCARRG